MRRRTGPSLFERTACSLSPPLFAPVVLGTPSSISSSACSTISHQCRSILLFVQHLRTSQIFRPRPSVIKMLLCPLQSSRHVFCVEARHIMLAHLAPAVCFTRIIHSCTRYALTCSLCEKRRERFPREVTFALLLQALERVQVSVRQRTWASGSRLSRDRFLCPPTLQDFIPLRLTHPPFLHRSVIATCPVFVAKCAVLANAARSSSLMCRPSLAFTRRGALNRLNRGPRTVHEGVSLRFCSLSLTGRVHASP